MFDDTIVMNAVAFLASGQLQSLERQCEGTVDAGVGSERRGDDGLLELFQALTRQISRQFLRRRDADAREKPGPAVVKMAAGARYHRSPRPDEPLFSLQLTDTQKVLTDMRQAAPGHCRP